MRSSWLERRIFWREPLLEDVVVREKPLVGDGGIAERIDQGLEVARALRLLDEPDTDVLLLHLLVAATEVRMARRVEDGQPSGLALGDVRGDTAQKQVQLAGSIPAEDDDVQCGHSPSARMSA